MWGRKGRQGWTWREVRAGLCQCRGQSTAGSHRPESGVGKGLIGSHQWDSLARGGLARPWGSAHGLRTGLALPPGSAVPIQWPCQLQADTVCRVDTPSETTARLC